MPAPIPTCPRCAYDLSGAIAAWPPDCCPMEGVCSECGLRFLSRDVLNPLYWVSDRFFETAQRTPRRAFAQTCWWAIRPRRLWRLAQMQFPVRPGRLAALVATEILVLWAIGAILMATYREVLHELPWMSGLAFDDWTWLPRVVWPVGPDWPWTRFNASEWLPPWLALGWIWLLITPLTFRLIPQTLRTARVRRIHIVRIWAYSLVGVPLLMYVPPLLEIAAGLVPGAGLPLRWIEAHPALLALLLLLLWGGWIALCWASAAKHYLKLDRPRLITLVLVALGGLATVTLALVAAGASSSITGWMLRELS